MFSICLLNLFYCSYITLTKVLLNRYVVFLVVSLPVCVFCIWVFLNRFLYLFLMLWCYIIVSAGKGRIALVQCVRLLHSECYCQKLKTCNSAGAIRCYNHSYLGLYCIFFRWISFRLNCFAVPHDFSEEGM